MNKGLGRKHIRPYETLTAKGKAWRDANKRCVPGWNAAAPQLPTDSPEPTESYVINGVDTATIKPGTIVWKKALIPGFTSIYTKSNQVLVEMEVVEPGFTPKYDRGYFNCWKKSRVRAVKVLSTTSIESGEHVLAVSSRSVRPSQIVEYRVGQVARPDAFSTSNEACDNGIHCFLHKSQAIDYSWQ